MDEYELVNLVCWMYAGIIILILLTSYYIHCKLRTRYLKAFAIVTTCMFLALLSFFFICNLYVHVAMLAACPPLFHRSQNLTCTANTVCEGKGEVVYYKLPVLHESGKVTYPITQTQEEYVNNVAFMKAYWTRRFIKPCISIYRLLQLLLYTKSPTETAQYYKLITIQTVCINATNYVRTCGRHHYKCKSNQVCSGGRCIAAIQRN